MLFQKILDSVNSKVDMDYTYKEIEDNFIGLLIPTGDNDTGNSRTLEIAYSFLHNKELNKAKHFTPWYRTFAERGVKIISAKMKPHFKTFDRLFFYFLLPNTIHSNELAYFCDKIGSYFMEKGIINKRASKLAWFNPNYKIRGRDFLSFESIKNYDPMKRYNIKSKKARDAFRDILSESVKEFSDKEIFNHLIYHVPVADDHKSTRMFAGTIDDFIKQNKEIEIYPSDNFKPYDEGIRVVSARLKAPLSGEAKHHLYYYIIFPGRINATKLDGFLEELKRLFIEKGFIKNTLFMGDWFPKGGFFPGSTLLEHFKDFKEFEHMSEYKMKSSKARDTFKDIFESAQEGKVYSKEELQEFDKHSLYSNRKDADFVFDFLKLNPKFKNDYKIVVRKKKTMPSGFTLIPDDMFFILLRKTQHDYYHARVAFSFALDKAHLEKKGVPFFYDYRHVKYDKASSITNLGQIEDYDPLDRYEVKQKTKDLFGDVLRESLSDTENKVKSSDLNDSTMAYISSEESAMRLNMERMYYDFIKNRDVSRYNLDFKTFYEAGLRVIYDDSNKTYHLIIPNEVFHDEVSKSVFDIELDQHMKRGGIGEGQRWALIKNIYLPTAFRNTGKLYYYHPLIKYDMKSSKARETFEDII
jgi:hypothetical protein